MFVFPKQEAFNIAGVKVGGQMNNPCVLIGTIFYRNEGIFRDRKNVRFDGMVAESLVNRVEELSDEIGNPSMVDIYLENEECVGERIDFVADRTDLPILIDSTDSKTRILALEYVQETGLIDRTVYNSINAGLGDWETGMLGNFNLGSAIVLAFNPLDNSLEGRINLLENGGDVLGEGLLKTAGELGVRKVMIDSGVTPLGDGGGLSVFSVLGIKSKFGLPTGNGIHNIVSAWPWSRKWGLSDIDSASNAISRVLGSDFLLYGPIEAAERVFRTVALSECLIAEVMGSRGFPIDGIHPYGNLVG